jgi:hypothetical protein
MKGWMLFYKGGTGNGYRIDRLGNLNSVIGYIGIFKSRF